MCMLKTLAWRHSQQFLLKGKRKNEGRTKQGGPGDGSLPVGSRGETPVGGVGDKVTQKLKHFLYLNTKFCNEFLKFVLLLPFATIKSLQELLYYFRINTKIA